MVIMLVAVYGYYARSVLWLLYYQWIVVIMLVACYGHYVRSVLWLSC